jgi:prevent-host-death family protein
MRAAGVREVKNKLSEYLRLVAQGETVLVTDHGRVVAQLAPPPLHGTPALTEDEALERLAAAGKIRLATSRFVVSETRPVVSRPSVDLEAVLEEVRADRFEG